MVNIINSQNIITSKQIAKVLKLTKFTQLDKVKIVILEKKSDVFKSKNILDYIDFLLDVNCEGSYSETIDRIMIKLYNLDGNKQDKRLYGIGVLLHELKHRDDIMLTGKTTENSADKYAVKFLNSNSKAIKDILRLKDEWEIEDF
jgi:hypothetical protein